MSNKKLFCFYTEGETDLAFYNILLENMKQKSKSKKFSADRLEKQNIKGIGNFQNKLLRKFRNEIMPFKKEGYSIVVFLCYDKDVFVFSQQPPIDRRKLAKELKQYGADDVIHVVANKSIEDIFLIDEENIVSFLHLKIKNKKSNDESGYYRLSKMYKQANLIYVKGEKVEEFVKKLDIEKICHECCGTFKPICDLLFSDLNCKKE